MVNYKSNTGKTISIDRYQVTTNPGIDLFEEDKNLEALVTEGVLIKEGGAVVETPKPVMAVPTKFGISKY